MAARSGEPKLFFPGLADFYESVSDLWYPMIRIVAGAPLFVHVWPKLMNPAGTVAFLAKAGFHPFFTYSAMFLETVGAACIILGLFTRFFAAALAIEMAVITFVYMLPQGWGRMEPTFIWGVLFLAIALRGGGPYSLDRLIGKEL
ncbi:MAG TPA: DoxX family protein [Pseudolabrys sp.]